MFGRRDRDEEYIAPSEEYRDECDDHEHGQTYENYDRYMPRNEDYRRDCDHDHEQTYNDLDRYASRNYDYRSSNAEKYGGSDYDYTAGCGDRDHGQTYEDYNSEQSDYDTDIEHKMEVERYLAPDEILIWFEHQRKDASRKECKSSNVCYFVMGIVVLVILAGSDVLLSQGIVPFLLLLLMKLPFILPFSLIAFALMKKRPATYAITDKRVLTVYKGRVGSAPLDRITVYGIRKFSSSRKIGWLEMPTMSMSLATDVAIGPPSYAAGRISFAGITDPDRVQEILKDAIKQNLNRKNAMRDKKKAAKDAEMAKLREQMNAEKAARSDK